MIRYRLNLKISYGVVLFRYCRILLIKKIIKTIGTWTSFKNNWEK